MRSYLSSQVGADILSIGFPRRVLARMPPDDGGAWIAENPEERAAMVARLTSKNISTDKSLASRITGAYGDNAMVAGEYFSEYASGGWSRPTSAHWDPLADSLEEVAGRTALPKLCRWAADSAKSLRWMAERDRHLEEELHQR